jgi:hypothetical protein
VPLLAYERLVPGGLIEFTLGDGVGRLRETSAAASGAEDMRTVARTDAVD